jgi:hypothetical protein
MYPLPPGVQPIPESHLLPPRYLVSLQSSPPTKLSKEIPPAGTMPFTIKQNNRITAPGHWQDVRHLILETTSTLNNKPSDVAVLYPSNPVEEVDIFLDTLDWSHIADTPLQITNTLTSPHPLRPTANGRRATTYTLRSTHVTEFSNVIFRYLFRSPPFILRNAKPFLFRPTTHRKIPRILYDGWTRRVMGLYYSSETNNRRSPL